MIEKAIGWLSRRRFKKHPLLYQLYPHMESLPTRFEKSDPSVHLYWTKDVFEAKRPRYMEVLVETLMKITEDKINETQLLQVYRNLVADNTLEFAKYYTFYNDEDNEEYTSHPCMSYLGDYQEKLISKYWYEDYRVLGGAAECKVQLFSWWAEAFSTITIGSIGCNLLGDNVSEWFSQYVRALCAHQEIIYRDELGLPRFELTYEAIRESEELHQNVTKGYLHPLEGVELLDHSIEPKLAT